VSRAGRRIKPTRFFTVWKRGVNLPGESKKRATRDFQSHHTLVGNDQGQKSRRTYSPSPGKSGPFLELLAQLEKPGANVLRRRIVSEQQQEGQ